MLSTFAAAHLRALPPDMLVAYDRLLDENDWDIYHWATQPEAADAASSDAASSDASASASATPPGEWAQTVGNVRPAHRPVPSRWRGSPLLALLRDHVARRSAAGADPRGMAFMPPLRGPP